MSFNKRKHLGNDSGINSGRVGATQAPVGGLFDPLTLSPYLWNRAEDVTLSGSDIVQFTDLAGNGNYLKQDLPVGARPQQVDNVPGAPMTAKAAKFDGVNNRVYSHLDLGLELVDYWELYVVSRYNTAEANEFSIGTAGGNNGGRWYKQSNKLKVRNRDGGGNYENFVLDSINSPLYALHRTTKIDANNDPIPIAFTGFEHRLNIGATRTVEIPFNAGFWNDFQGNMIYGGSGGTPVVAQDFDGWLFDIMLFKRRLTPQEENNLICNYFNKKYAIF